MLGNSRRWGFENFHALAKAQTFAWDQGVIVPILPVVQRAESSRCTIALVIAAEVYWERAKTQSVLNNCEGINLACKSGTEEFRPDCEYPIGSLEEVNLDCKNGMEECRPDCEYSSGSLEELIWLAKWDGGISS